MGVADEKSVRMIGRCALRRLGFDYSVLSARDYEAVGVVLARGYEGDRVDVFRALAQQCAIKDRRCSLGATPYSN